MMRVCARTRRPSYVSSVHIRTRMCVCVTHTHIRVCVHVYIYICRRVHVNAQVTMDSWPWKLHSKDPDALRDFYAAHSCCIDAWFGEVIREAYPTQVGAMVPDFAEMQRIIARHLPMCNMGLEALIALVRQAVPYSKAKPSIEALAYLGMLQQASLAHANSGGQSLFQDRRKELELEGLPLLQATKASRRLAAGWRRTDVAWANRGVHIHKRDNPACTRAEARLKFNELLEQYAAMTPEQRAAVDVQPEEEHRDIAAEIDTGITEDERQRLNGWLYGSGRWPISPNILSDFCGGRVSGFANCSHERRWSGKDRLVIQDENLIPDELAFEHRYSCSARHPGLCFTADADLYQDCCRLAASFERFFTTEDQGKYFRILDPDVVHHIPINLRLPPSPRDAADLKKLFSLCFGIIFGARVNCALALVTDLRRC